MPFRIQNADRSVSLCNVGRHARARQPNPPWSTPVFDMSAILEHLDPLLRRYGYGLIAVTTFGESFGLPLPGESAIVAASALCRRGVMSPWILMQVVAVSAFLGDNVGYLIGRTGGRRLVLRLGHWIHVTPGRLAWVERHVGRWGAWVIVVARFIVVLRQLNGIVAGVANMKWTHFAAANAVGAILWGAFWSLMPYYFVGLFGVE